MAHHKRIQRPTEGLNQVVNKIKRVAARSRNFRQYRTQIMLAIGGRNCALLTPTPRETRRASKAHSQIRNSRETELMDGTTAELSGWLALLIADRGWKLVGDVELVKARPWATVVTADTTSGRLYAKANCDGLRSEAPLLELLADWVPDCVIEPFAMEASTGWFAIRDGGQTLLKEGLQFDLKAWAPVLARIAQAQRATCTRAEELLSVGVPDFRPHTVAHRLHNIVNDLGLTGKARDRVLAFEPGLAAAAAELITGPIGSAISHGDLQPNNMLAPPTSKPFDWGDAVIAHPFCTLTSLRWSIDDPNLYRILRRGYLAHWSDTATPCELEQLAEAAELVGCVASIWTWIRVGPAGIALHPNSIPTWFNRIEAGINERR
jgi:hypothetical protein